MLTSCRLRPLSVRPVAARLSSPNLARVSACVRGPSSARLYSAMPLPTVRPPVSGPLPSDAFQLLSTAEKTGAAEDSLFAAQVADVEAWWATPRFAGIRRPYSAADVVSKRGTLQQIYPSSLMARKLHALIAHKAARGEPLHTRECSAPLPVSCLPLTIIESAQLTLCK